MGTRIDGNQSTPSVNTSDINTVSTPLPEEPIAQAPAAPASLPPTMQNALKGNATEHKGQQDLHAQLLQANLNGQVQAGPSSVGQAQMPGDPKGIPGPMITVSIYDANHNFVTFKTEPLYGGAESDMFYGEVNGGKINWNEGNTKVNVDARIGVKLDKDGKPTGGMPVDKWVQQAGRGRGKYVLVEIDGGSLKGGTKETGNPGDANTTQSTQGNSTSGAGKQSQTQGAGEQGKSAGKPGGSVQTGGTGDGPTGATSKGKPAEMEGSGGTGKAETDQQGKAGGSENGSSKGKVGGRDTGRTDGKRDGTKTESGYFYDPNNKGKGTQDIAKEGGTKDGMVGGDGKPGDKGVPQGGGILDLIEVPSQIAPAVSVGLILADAGITQVTDDIIKISAKLGKAAAGKGGAIAKTITNRIERYADDEVKKVAKEMRKHPEFANKTVAEQKKILGEIRKEIRDAAIVRVRGELDDRIRDLKDTIDRVKPDAAKGHKIAQDILKESEEGLEAAARARKAMPEPSPASGPTPDEMLPGQTRPEKFNRADPRVSPMAEWDKIPKRAADPRFPKGPTMKEEVSKALDDYKKMLGGDAAAKRRIATRNPHPMTANDKGWTSLDIGPRHNPLRILVKEEDGVINWRIKDTHK